MKGDLQTLCASSSSGQEFVVSSEKELGIINCLNNQISKSVPCEKSIVIMKGGKLLACGEAEGPIRLRDPRSLDVIGTIQAHIGAISDFDFNGNYIISSGYSTRAGNLIPENSIKVFDVRTLRSVVTIPFMFGSISSVKFQVNSPLHFLTTSHSGIVQSMDFNGTSFQPYQLQNTEYISCMDISSTGNLMMFGESNGIVHEWILDDSQCFINFGSMKMENIRNWFNDHSPVCEPLSEWPKDLPFSLYTEPEAIDVRVRSSTEDHGWFKVASNPGIKRYHRSAKNAQFNSKFISQKSAEEIPDAPKKKKFNVKVYRKLDVEYSKFGVEDFDFASFNNTCLSGLENDNRKGAYNSIFQLLAATKPFKAILKRHLDVNCSMENCVFCELAFLFGRHLLNLKENMENASGRICHASNLIGVLEKLMPITNQPLNCVDEAIDLYHFLMSKCPSFDNLFCFNVQQDNCCNSEDKSSFFLHFSYPNSLNMNALFSDIMKFSLETSFLACATHQNASSKNLIKILPEIITINTRINSSSVLDFWTLNRKKFWIPKVLAIQNQPQGIRIVEIKEESSVSKKEFQLYRLKAIISNIFDDYPNKSSSHIVSQLRIENHWILFNDFQVNGIPLDQVLNISNWKIPILIQYELIDIANSKVEEDIQSPSSIDLCEILTKNTSINNSEPKTFTPLNPAEIVENQPFLVAIDSEFVCLEREENEFTSDGKQKLLKPASLALARVSVLRENGIPFIDDFIEIKEKIEDYFTEFSGINPGDLDAATSKQYLTSRKIVYKKIRNLVKLGVCFIGHGLDSDFRRINIIVPPEQIIDTVELFRLKNKRKVSLRFLAWFFFKQDIQETSHCSIEDAQMALKLYKKYLELEASGKIAETLEEIYKVGRQENWKKK